MSGICPHCGEKLDYIHEVQKVEVCYDVRLNSTDEDVAYDKHDDYDTSADWGFAECPECNEVIEDITSEDKALKFLKGGLEARK